MSQGDAIWAVPVACLIFVIVLLIVYVIVQCMRPTKPAAVAADRQLDENPAYVFSTSPIADYARPEPPSNAPPDPPSQHQPVVDYTHPAPASQHQPHPYTPLQDPDTQASTNFPRTCMMRRSLGHGYGFSLVNGVDGGVYVTDVGQGRPAEFAGMRIGDKVMAVNGQDMSGQKKDVVAFAMKQDPNQMSVVLLSSN